MQPSPMWLSFWGKEIADSCVQAAKKGKKYLEYGNNFMCLLLIAREEVLS